MLIRSSMSSGSEDTVKSHGGPSRTLQAQETGKSNITKTNSVVVSMLASISS